MVSKVINKVGIFILPLLEIPIKHLKLLDNIYYDSDLDVCLMKFLKKGEDYTLTIFNEFVGYEANLEKSPHYLMTVELSEEIHILFKVPDTLMPDVDLLLKGKFSRLGPGKKDTIIRYVTSFMGLSLAARVEGILYQKEWLRTELENRIGMDLSEDSELSSIFTEQEFINISALNYTPETLTTLTSKLNSHA